MKIIIAGAGAMGSRFGLMLHQAGNDVIFVDGWPEHIEAIRKNGLVADFNGEVMTAKIPIYPQTEVASIDFTADLVILFTKAMQLAGMLESLEHFLNKNTKVFMLVKWNWARRYYQKIRAIRKYFIRKHNVDRWVRRTGQSKIIWQWFD